MMYCKHCGKEVYEDAVVCIHCGRSLKDSESLVEDSGHIGWGLLGFFVPLVGLILFILWREERPKNAKKAGTGALINLCIGVGMLILSILAMIIYVSVATATL